SHQPPARRHRRGRPALRAGLRDDRPHAGALLPRDDGRALGRGRGAAIRSDAAGATAPRSPDAGGAPRLRRSRGPMHPPPGGSRMTTIHRPETIPEAVAALSSVADWAAKMGSPIGYFPALHREVALAIGASIDAGDFDDGPRMVRMVGEFTYRYLDALHRFR